MMSATALFTDRFFKIPIHIFSRREKDLIGDEATPEKVWARIDPLQIEAYRGDIPGNEKRETVIYFKSGESMIAEWPIEKFEEKINKFIVEHS